MFPFFRHIYILLIVVIFSIIFLRKNIFFSRCQFCTKRYDKVLTDRGRNGSSSLCAER